MKEEDLRARRFHFKKQRTEINWQAVHGMSLESVTPAQIEQVTRWMPLT